MELIGAIRRHGEFRFYEAHYIFFILDLDSRSGEVNTSCRPGLGVVTHHNAADYIEFMEQFALDETDLRSDFESLTEEEARQSRPEFLPTVLVDFDNKLFVSSHPEDCYLNFEDYLPPEWKFERADDVALMIPAELAYWRSWSGLG